MDAKTRIESRLPSRHVTDAPARVPHRAYLPVMGLTGFEMHRPFGGERLCCNGAAPCNNNSRRDIVPRRALQHTATAARECGIRFDAAEIFKKPPYVPDLKPGGRYVAKDMREIGDMTLLPQTLLGFDADVGTLNVKLTDAERAERKTKWSVRTTNQTAGALLAQQGGPAVDGAVTHPGGAHEKQCYVDM